MGPTEEKNAKPERKNWIETDGSKALEDGRFEENECGGKKKEKYWEKTGTRVAGVKEGGGWGEKKEGRESSINRKQKERKV